MGEAMPQTLGFLVKGAFLFFVVLIVIFFVSGSVSLSVDDKGAKGVSREFVLLNDCLAYFDEGIRTNYIDYSKLTKENLRECGGGLRVAILDLDDNEILKVDSDDSRSLLIPQCVIESKDFECLNSKSLVRVVKDGKVSTNYLRVEMII